MPIDPESFDPTTDELEAMKRLEHDAAHVQIDTGLNVEPPARLVDLGFVAQNAEGDLALTARGLALVRHR